MKKVDIDTNESVNENENFNDNINDNANESCEAPESAKNAGETPDAEEACKGEETEVKDSNDDEKETKQQDPLDIALTEIEELKKQALYKQAEFENYRKRTLKEKAELILQGGEKTITAILPVLDDFERALADKSEDPQAIREGMQLIYQKLTKTLEGLGVKKIETEGQDFNVDYHESVALVPGMGEEKKGKVIDCVQTGYTLNDKVIRFAKVAVGQ
ncbi:MAG: nucleotide exchange factor GrpE [Prevotella sp.]|nr:nucleotide exchange factor GrpE [Prevotella sp.]